MKKILIAWLPFAVLVTALCGLVYATVQQNYRQNANDPQIQMAEDIADALETGKSPASFVSVAPVQSDIAKTLAPFVIIFDDSMHPIVSTAIVSGKTPIPPSGIFDFVKSHGEERLTWQPAEGVRIAAIVRFFAGSEPGFVLVGRSLREVEKREAQLGFFCLVAWIGLLVTTWFAAVFIAKN